MLAELAIANAAFAVIKEAVQNSGDIMNAGQALFQYFDTKSIIQKKANEKGPHRGDLEEFMALEQLKKQEEELREMMIYQGRAGLWTDWLKFQADARQRREEAEKERVRAEIAKREKRMEWLMNTFWTICLFGLLYVAYWLGELVWTLTRGR
jgi:nitrate reductase NapE component